MSDQDRGGIRFPIIVTDDLSGFDRFDRRMDQTMKRWDRFREEIGALGAAGEGAAARLKPLADATRALASADVERARALKSVEKAAKEEATAETRLEAILRARAQRQEVLNLADAKGADITSRQAQQLAIRQDAEARVSAAIRERAVREQFAIVAAERGLDLAKKKVAALSVEEKAQRALAKWVEKLAVAERLSALAKERGIKLTKESATALSAEAEAARRAARAKREAEIQSALTLDGKDSRGRPINPTTPRGLSPVSPVFRPTTPPGIAPALTNFDDLERVGQGNFFQRLGLQIRDAAAATDGANGALTQFLFTFRRLVGVFAVFQAVRVAFNGVVGSLKEAVQFSARLEQTTLGIASVIAAVATVSTASGGAADAVRKLALAQEEAKKQVSQLRVEALRTSASFEELAETFQVAIGPGLQAGLTLDEIRKLSVRISQSAAAIGLPQNQLPEEIRSLLTGTIQPRTTRIATVLGLDNPTIERAREAGKLAQLLEERFASFATAAEQSATNFNVLLANLKDGFSQLLGESAKGIFTELKGLIGDILTGLISVSAQGVEISPRALQIVNGITSGVESLVASVRGIFASIDLGALGQIADFFGNVLGGIGKIAGLLLPPFVELLGSVSAVLNGIFKVVGALHDLVFSTSAVGRAMKSIVGFVALWYGTFRLLTTAAPVLVAATTAIRNATAATALASSGAGFLGIGGSISALLAAVTPLGLLAGALAAAAAASFAFASGTDEAGEAVKKSRERFESFGAVIEQVGAGILGPSKALQENAEAVRKLGEEYLKAAQSLRIALDTAGATGNAVEQVRTITAVTNKFLLESKDLTSEKKGLQERVNSLLGREAQIQETAAKFEFIRTDEFAALVQLGRERLDLIEQIAAAEASLANTTGLQRTAIEGQIVSLRERAALNEENAKSILDRPAQESRSSTLGQDLRARTEALNVQSAVQSQLAIERDKKQIAEQLLEIDRKRGLLQAQIAASQFATVRENLLKAQTTLDIELATSRAQIASARVRERAVRESRAGGFVGSETIDRVLGAQAEVSLLQQKLVVTRAQNATEVTNTELAIARTTSLIGELERTLEIATAEADREKVQEGITEATAAREALEKRLAVLRKSNAAEETLAEAKILETVTNSFLVSEKSATAREREAKVRKRAADDANEAERRRSVSLAEQEARIGAIGDAEKALRAAREGIVSDEARAELAKATAAEATRALEIELSTLQAQRDRIAGALRLLGFSEDQVRGAAAVVAADRAILAVERDITAQRAVASGEAGAERAKSLNAAREALVAIRETAAVETIQGNERIKLARADLVTHEAATKLRAIEVAQRFGIAEGVRTIVRLDGDLTGAKARLQILKAQFAVEDAKATLAIEAIAADEARTRAAIDGATGSGRVELETRLNSLTETRIALEERLKTVRQGNLLQLGNEINAIADKSIAAFDGIRAAAISGARSASQGAGKTEAENAANAANIAARTRLLTIERQIIEARGDVTTAEASLEILKAQNELEERKLRVLLEQAQAALAVNEAKAPDDATRADPATISTTILDLENQLLEVQRQNTAERLKQLAAVEELKTKLELLRFIEEQPVKAGALVAFKQLYEEATNTFQFTLDFTKQAITGFASTVSGILTDALDPSKDVDIKEQFRQFFLGLLNSITTFLITLGLVTAALSVIPGFKESLQLVAAFNGATGGGIGRARGGPAPSSAPASLAHYAAPRGFARGGRPAGLDPRDTIPIWVRPGEYVLRPEAVDRYGMGTIEALNRGLIDPSALGGVSVTGLSPIRSPGFARGGSISGALAGAAERAEAPPPQVIQPVLVCSEGEAERIFAGGPGAFNRALRRERGTIAGMTQATRGGRG